MATLQKLETVDADGADALVYCRAHRCGDLLRMVYSAIPIVLGRMISGTFDRLADGIGGREILRHLRHLWRIIVKRYATMPE